MGYIPTNELRWLEVKSSFRVFFQRHTNTTVYLQQKLIGLTGDEVWCNIPVKTGE